MNTQSAPESPLEAERSSTTPEGWLSVADFAQARGCSIRTVKRWIESGEVNTRKDGARRFVRALEEGTQGDTEGTQQKGHEPDSVSLSPLVHAQKEGHKGDTEGTQAVSLSSDREEGLRDELARERELNGFLRGLIEGHQRSEAELRAALREALKIAPRQLSAGAFSTNGNGPQNGAMGNDGPGASNGDESAPGREETPVSYGSIADE